MESTNNLEDRLFQEIRRRYEEPASLEDAQARRAAVLREIQEMEIQLADSRRMEVPDREGWRARAVFNFKVQNAILGFLKTWIHNERERRNREKLPERDALANAGLDNAESLLAAAHELLRGLARGKRVVYSQEEQAVIDLIREYVQKADDPKR